MKGMYDDIGFEGERGVFYFEQDGKCGYINTKSEIIVQAIYDGCSDFNNGFAQVEQNGLLGFIDQKGKVVIEPQYDYASYIWDDGNALVYINDKFGIIDSTGKYVLEPIYEDLLGYREYIEYFN